MMRTSFAAICFAALAATATAADLTAVQTVQKVIQTVDESGAMIETLEDAVTVAPGDTVVYSLEYAYTGDEAAEGVTLTMPVPEEVVLLEGSEMKAGTVVTYSIDGGETFSSRDALVVGAGEESRAAMADEITHVKWMFEDDVPAGSEGAISFRGLLQ